MCAIYVQYVHAALIARKAWPSFSCCCVSTGEACQTPGSPFQRCQRTFQVLSGARIENKGGENKGGKGGCLWLAPKPQKGSLQKWQEAMDTAHSLLQLYLCNMIFTQSREIQYQLRAVRWKSDTSSLVLSTSLGSLALPLLVIMSIS